MKIFAKSAAALVAVATLAAAVPASAQNWNDGPRRDYRYDNNRHDDWRGDRNDGRRWNDNRRWDDNRRWNDNGRWNDNQRFRQHCWTEKRWDPYRHKRVKVRLCNRY